ncbi:pentatricopeptide repeat-containing protein At2g30780-like isoform X2 [Phragmites australis]|uniref:pentatricopeptide repeat-containing protein At2g30780-like isoform X2 n=1 Tax=Phragmites australis TaxID=29695 RepID=UPI002D785F16|nr:pentatricopeptide repeat-containing protein At2g30780-like isoform X2 [Phragmites australis]
MSRRPARRLLPLFLRGLPRSNTPRSFTSIPVPPDTISSTSFTWPPQSPPPAPDPAARWTASWSPTALPLPPFTAAHLSAAVSSLAASLLALVGPNPDSEPTLRAHSFPTLLSVSPLASLELLSLLRPRPQLGLAVFSFRRALSPPPTLGEYSLAISLASRARDPAVAATLFADATSAHSPDQALYNALMAAYMHSGLLDSCLEAFDALERDPRCGPPNVDSYNILIALFGRSLLVDHMEATLRSLDASGHPRTIGTYNAVIAGYLTAWMWDKMEGVFHEMESGHVAPDATTHLLMLRGYAHAGMIYKMELAYERACKHAGNVDIVHIRAMLCAYCKFAHVDRIQKIEDLLQRLGRDDYRPWLNVLLIRVYAQEGLVDGMELQIAEALERNIIVNTVQAEQAGWKLCRSLYHCKMVMYGKHHRLEEMHGVLDEMEWIRFDRTKKTFWIMHKAYVSCGRRAEANTILAMMWKHGFGLPRGVFVQ